MSITFGYQSQQAEMAWWVAVIQLNLSALALLQCMFSVIVEHARNSTLLELSFTISATVFETAKNRNN